MHIKSPITNSHNVLFEEEISIDVIIEKYIQDYQIDVSLYFSEVDSLKIYRCLDTGYRFYFPLKPTGDGDLYEKLQEQPWYYGIRWEHLTSENFVKANDLVLEIGCGRGYFLEKLSNKGILCTGLELNEDAVDFVKSKGLNVLKQDIKEHAIEYCEKYDVVCYFQVLEHVPNVNEFIQASLDALKTGGKLIIGVPIVINFSISMTNIIL
ncbi:MAG: methyltransferase domain-containing protein [Calothrix sp. SM1_7_51]|nr:methyltransferase domain-containing protein [Calothrix sp. SM1_7_51]